MITKRNKISRIFDLTIWRFFDKICNIALYYITNDQEEIHLNEIMEYMETKGYVWKQQTAYSFVIRLKNKKILSSTKRGKRRYYSVNMSRKEFIAKGVQEYLNLAYDGSLLVFLRSLEGDHGLSEEHKQELQQFVKEQQEKEEERQKQEESSEKTE